MYPLNEHKYSIVWLHGLGDSALGFADVFLDPIYKFVPHSCKVLLLTAPERPVSLNGGMMMNSWYDISELRAQAKTVEDLQKMYDKKQMLESIDIVSKFLDQEVETLGDSKKVFIGGFSQGCALSLATFINYHKVLGGMIGLSGMNALNIDWNNVKDLESKKKQPIFLYHGESDEMIRYQIAMLTYKELQNKGFNITLNSEPGLGHSLGMDEIAKLKDFMKDIMK